MSRRHVPLTLVHIAYRFDNNLSVWKASDALHPTFVATSEASHVSMLRGTHVWVLHNDSSLCSSSQTYTRYEDKLPKTEWNSDIRFFISRIKGILFTPEIFWFSNMANKKFIWQWNFDDYLLPLLSMLQVIYSYKLLNVGVHLPWWCVRKYGGEMWWTAGLSRWIRWGRLQGIHYFCRIWQIPGASSSSRRRQP